MKIYDASEIRNLCLIGHGHAGKTSLVSAMLFDAGAVNRLGKVDDGSTTTDFDDESVARDTFAGGLLDYPQYTRPAVFQGHEVPEVLLSGHHGAIARWRRHESLSRTLARRPELLDAATLADEDRAVLDRLKGKS